MNFDPFVFVQVLIGFAVGLAPAIWLLGKNRTLERYVAALEKQADEVFFNQLHVERLVYKSSVGYFFKDHFVNFEEQLFYKQFPLTDRQPRKLPIGQNVDIAALLPLVEAASAMAVLPVPVKIRASMVEGAGAAK